MQRRRNNQPLTVSRFRSSRNLISATYILVSSSGAVVILDSLNRFATSMDELVGFLSSIITPSVSIVAVYHADVPIVPPRTYNEYAPPPLTLLVHMATAVLRLSNLHHEIERQKARNRSLENPEFGLGEGKEGVLVGLHDNPRSAGGSGLVVEMELRRRSGRSVTESFVVMFPDNRDGQSRRANACLLDTHPAFASPGLAGTGGGADVEDEQPESTFNLGLTEKQRKDREGIVLPYFDAQTDIGGGEGGRILYDMGREDMDDFDDEEDEV
jgi:elongator complex protein 5